MMYNQAMKLDLIGYKSGRLTVVAFERKAADGSSIWRCACDCGAMVGVIARNLRSGNTKSCGCLRRERASSSDHGHKRRGLSSPTYVSWSRMMQRCNDPNSNRWSLYGGRGITVCPQWRTFQGFLADMGERPPGKTLDRINVDGNYEPDNCRWATASEQARNRRKHDNSH